MTGDHLEMYAACKSIVQNIGYLHMGRHRSKQRAACTLTADLSPTLKPQQYFTPPECLPQPHDSLSHFFTYSTHLARYGSGFHYSSQPHAGCGHKHNHYRARGPTFYPLTRLRGCHDTYHSIRRYPIIYCILLIRSSSSTHLHSKLALWSGTTCVGTSNHQTRR